MLPENSIPNEYSQSILKFESFPYIIKILRGIHLLKPYVNYTFMGWIIFKIYMNLKAYKKGFKKENINTN